jgi:hypothetical protein
MKSYFGRNHHQTVTKDNFKLMNTLEGKHYSKIKSEAGDPDFDAMILFFDPYHTAWVNGYGGWKSASNSSQGKTIELREMFATLTNINMPKWEITIYGFYPEGSARATALLPHKRTPFISGAQYDRITALSTLVTTIGSDANLAAMKADIIAFHADILKCYTENQGSKKTVSDLSDDLEPIRIATAQAMFANEGMLMKKFYKTPEKVDNYFDVQSMRQAAKIPGDDGGLNVPLLPAQILLLDIQFKGTEVWQVENLGDKDACVFFSDRDDVTEIPDAWKYVITNELPIEIDLSSIPKDKRFVYAANLSSEDDGELNITEIK